MHYEMRRPEVISVDAYVASLDARLRDEIPRIKRWVAPLWLRHPIETMKRNARPMLQGGAMVLTALAIIVAVGVAPATVTPGHTETEIRAPTVSVDILVSNADLPDRLQTLNVLAVQEPDIVDTPSPNLE